MAGHSHWAGIKHKKGRADKERSKLFSKLSREITVAAKLGDKNPEMNPRLRSAIQAAKQSNMPKENISRAISKSELSEGKNYDQLKYEAFGPNNTALIIESLTDNKNRSASSIRTVLQKKGGRLGETGSAKHLFFSCGIIRIKKIGIDDNKVLELTTSLDAKDFSINDDFYEIITEKENFYKIKVEIEKKIGEIIYSGLEWRAYNQIDLDSDQAKNFIDLLGKLDELDDVQNIYTNVNLNSFKI